MQKWSINSHVYQCMAAGSSTCCKDSGVFDRLLICFFLVYNTVKLLLTTISVWQAHWSSFCTSLSRQWLLFCSIVWYNITHLLPPQYIGSLGIRQCSYLYSLLLWLNTNSESISIIPIIKKTNKFDKLQL